YSMLRPLPLNIHIGNPCENVKTEESVAAPNGKFYYKNRSNQSSNNFTARVQYEYDLVAAEASITNCQDMSIGHIGMSAVKHTVAVFLLMKIAVVSRVSLHLVEDF
ncbi:hypothetical protein L9F63_003903, partial [Diploptera punctata]